MDGGGARGSRPKAAIDPAVLKALCRRSDDKGLKQLAGHLALLCLTGTLVLGSRDSLWLAPALFGHGLALVFLFAPLHECIHRTAFRSRRLNDAVAAVCGVILLLPAGYFRAFHFCHHRHTQVPGRDPELCGRPLAGRRDYLLHVSGLPYWGERLRTTCRHAAGRVPEPFLPAQRHKAITGEARAHLALYALLAAGSLATGNSLMLLLWVIPAVLAQPCLRLYLLAEHTGCPKVQDMLANSRTTLTHRAVEALCWHMNRHTAHHAYPALPFHALPAADRLLAAYTAERVRGYVAVQRRIWQQLARA